MATISKVKTKAGIAWKVQVRVTGAKAESKRFKIKVDAQAWGARREAELRSSSNLIGGVTLGDAFKRYSDELPSDRKGLHWDTIRLKKFQSDPIARVPASDLKLEDAEAFIDRGLAAGLAPNTIIREMNLIKPVVRKMIRWKWINGYPWDLLKMPSAGKRRSKLYTQDEIDLLLETAGLIDGEPISTVTQQVAIAFLVATESGMRLGEIVAIEDGWWNRQTSVIHLPHAATKTDTARDVPLSGIATAALSRLEVRSNGKLFTVKADSASTLFRKIRRIAKITDGTFHDSRHYAVTKLSKVFLIMDLARVIGHVDIKQLMTYYEVDAADLATKLNP